MGGHRAVKDNKLISTHDPALCVKVADGLTYLGQLDYVCDGQTAVEAHYFVAADEQRKVERVLLFQFEHFLPESDWTYSENYPQRIRLGASEYMDYAGFFSVTGLLQARRDQRWLEGIAFVQEKGYSWWDDLLYQRFMRILDGERRRALNIFYFEDLAPAGFSFESLLHADPQAWESIKQLLHERALSSFAVLQG